MIVEIITTKVWAIRAGPEGVALLGLALSLINFSAIIGGIGAGAGLVRLGAAAIAQGDSAAVGAYRRAAFYLVVIVGGLTAFLMIVFRESVSRTVFGGLVGAPAVIWLQVGLLATLITSVQVGVMNAHHRVRSLAQNTVMTSILAGGISVTLAVLLGRSGIVWALVGSAIVAALVSRYYLSRALPARVEPPPRARIAAAARGLVRFGGPYAASLLVGSGVLVVMPAVVLHSLGEQSAGFYRASITISVGYFGFLAVSLAQDYYPRIAALSDQPADLIAAINRQARLVLLIITPLALLALSLTSIVMTVFFSPEFTTASRILEWQLVGELFKFLSWTLGIVVLSTISQVVYFLTELASGVMILSLSWFGIQIFGEAGLGVAYMFAYFGYLLLVWYVLFRRIGFRWTIGNLKLMLAAIAAVLLARMFLAFGPEPVTRPALVGVALASAIFSWWLLRREVQRDHVTS